MKGLMRFHEAVCALIEGALVLKKETCSAHNGICLFEQALGPKTP